MFRLVRDGETLAPSQYCRSAGVGHRTLDDVVRPNRVVELHRQGGDARAPGAAAHRPPPGALRQQPGAGPRSSRPGQRLPDASRRHGARAPLRLPRRLRRAARRPQAVAGVVAVGPDDRSRPPRPAPADADVRRVRPAGARSHARRRRLPLPAAWLPPRRRGGRRRLQPPHRRRDGGDVAEGLTAAVDAALAEPGLRASLPAGVLAGADPGRRRSTRCSHSSIPPSSGPGWPTRSGAASRRHGWPPSSPRRPRPGCG